ncbi:hypothetical protein CPB84DRAFT_1751335 [Gymnopilus junonius]|uniref:Uncharacterized protein n=1 Tax=Gymnopilus junonius TaxID=109634 RepID=A0A9P5TH87_GYMJU|nr:hypothetical protein CPB84DRAFT_1751335 [Gymnopilus junonius]
MDMSSKKTAKFSGIVLAYNICQKKDQSKQYKGNVYVKAITPPDPVSDSKDTPLRTKFCLSPNAKPQSSATFYIRHIRHYSPFSDESRGRWIGFEGGWVDLCWVDFGRSKEWKEGRKEGRKEGSYHDTETLRGDKSLVADKEERGGKTGRKGDERRKETYDYS